MNLSLLLCSHLLLILKNVSLSEFSSCDSADTNGELPAILKNTPEAAYFYVRVKQMDLSC